MARTSGAALGHAQFFINTADNDFLELHAPNRRRAGVMRCSARSSAAPRWSTRSRRCKTGRKGGHDDVPLETCASSAPSKSSRRRHARHGRSALPAARGVGVRADAAWRAIDFISDLHLCEAQPRDLRRLGGVHAPHAGRCGRSSWATCSRSGSATMPATCRSSAGACRC